MIARIRKSLDEEQKGFTLVELLVVVIIIGILAAIAIPVFLNQRQRAWVAAVESDLKNAAIAAETWAVDNNGSYDGLSAEKSATVVSSIHNLGYRETEGVTISIGTPTNADEFTLTGVHGSLGDRSWTYSSKTGVPTENGSD